MLAAARAVLYSVTSGDRYFDRGFYDARAALAEAVPLVGVAVSCYLVTHGNPMYAACLLVGT